MDFKLVLPSIYINFDIQTKFEVIQTQIGHSILKNSKNSPKWPYLKSPFCPSVIHQKAYSSYIFGFWTQIFFGGLNQKSAMISMCKIHIYIDSESFRQIHWKM